MEANRNTQSLTVTPLTGCLGAKIEGLRIGEPLSRGVLARLKDALREYKVVALPDQGEVSPVELLAFSELFGVPELAQHVQHHDDPEAPGVKVLHSNAATDVHGESWHTDGATRDCPQWITILQAIDVPPYGRDTLFADMEAAYARLSPAMQAFLADKTALHSWGIQKPDEPPVEHSLIRADPLTGRKTLYANKVYTRRIVGLSEAESDLLLQYFFTLPRIPELQARISWQPGTVVLWDNERVQHYLVMDKAYPRVMRRVMVSGEPVRRPADAEEALPA